MRRFSLGLAIAALPAFVFSVMLAGCGSKDSPSSSSSGSGEVAKTAPSGPAKVLEPKGGVLKGKITLLSRPNVEELTKILQDEIAKKANEKDFCLSGSPGETTQQQYRIGKNGNLGNVFVWIVPESGTIFKVEEKQLAAAKEHPVKIRQPHCAFVPHCAVAWVEYYPDPKKPTAKKPTGQYVEVVNDAPVGHNTNYAAGPNNPSGNPTLPPKKTEKIETLRAVSVPMTLKCNIHTWMTGYVRLLDTPYYAISYSDTLDGDNKVKEDDAKFGTYEIKNLPVGKVRVVVWHEEYNYITTGGSKGEAIEILEGKPTEKNFEAKPKQ